MPPLPQVGPVPLRIARRRRTGLPAPSDGTECRPWESRREWAARVAGLRPVPRDALELLADFRYDVAWGNSEPPTARELDIWEVVFRQLCEDLDTGNWAFLALAGKDPSPEFLERFARHPATFRKMSEWRLGKGGLYKVSRVEWLTRDRCRVLGGYFADGLAAAENEYFLKRGCCGWEIYQERGLWIS